MARQRIVDPCPVRGLVVQAHPAPPVSTAVVAQLVGLYKLGCLSLTLAPRGFESHLPPPFLARSPSGKAEDFESSILGSNPNRAAT